MNKVKDSTRVPFHYIVSSAAVSNVAYLPVNNSLAPRLTTEADAWALFKVASLKFRLHPSSGNDLIAGLFTGVADTPPGSFAAVSELISSALSAGSSSVPTEWVTPSASELAGYFPWYKTVPGSLDASEEAPCTIALWSASASGTFALELRGEYVYRDAIATANTPELVALRAKVRAEQRKLRADAERRQVLDLLAGKPGGSATGGVVLGGGSPPSSGGPPPVSVSQSAVSYPGKLVLPRQ